MMVYDEFGKRCPRCLDYKTLNLFNKSSRTKDGHRYECRECQKVEYLLNRERRVENAMEWIKNNPEKRRQIVARNNAKSAQRKRRWHEIKMFGQFIDRSHCGMCLETPDKPRNLVVHHRDGNNGKLGKPLNNKPDNLVVLCRTCHPKVHNRWKLKVLTK